MNGRALIEEARATGNDRNIGTRAHAELDRNWVDRRHFTVGLGNRALVSLLPAPGFLCARNVIGDVGEVLLQPDRLAVGQ